MIRLARTSWPLIALLTLGTFLISTLAFAQSGVNIRISSPNTTQFPTVTMSLFITDTFGRHVPDLSVDNFTILEDGEAIGIDRVEEVTVGTQQIFILNTSRGLRGRDAYGLTRYDYIRSALIEWWGKEEAATIGIDDLTLLSMDGALTLHSPLAAELASAINAYEPEFLEETATFNLLLEALELSADAVSTMEIPTLIFFITPFIDEPQDLPLANTISWAKDRGITIYPILVGPEDLLEYPQVDNLELLAETTGGEMIFFDADAGLDFLAERILTRRKLYNLSYTSKANTSRSHNLQVRITSDEVDVLSDPISYPINISTPEVIFIQPPSRIVRKSSDESIPLESISPTSTTLQVLVMFPDGYPREIQTSQLIVDDQIISIRSEAPFDTFEWDISRYEETATHEIKVMVEDTLGLQGHTSDTAVVVEVILPPSGISTFKHEPETILTITGIIFFVGVLSATVITLTRRRRFKASSSSQEMDPRAQNRQATRSNRKLKQGLVEATLEPFSSQIHPVNLIGTDLVLGRDSTFSVTHIDEPSVSALHARLIRLANGDYLIRDQGSVAGTWVNYQSVPKRGKILEHGDLIHLGRVVFRFQLPNPPPESRYRVESIDADKQSAGSETKITRENSDE
jgi:hypothetical protein